MELKESINKAILNFELKLKRSSCGPILYELQQHDLDYRNIFYSNYNNIPWL